MHELGIVFSIIKTVNRAAEKGDAEHVASVTLQLGEVSGVVPRYLAECWEWAVKKEELLKGAKLKVETIPARTFCEGCGASYSTVEHGKVCPACGSEDTWLLQGNEMVIKEIAVR